VEPAISDLQSRQTIKSAIKLHLYDRSTYKIFFFFPFLKFIYLFFVRVEGGWDKHKRLSRIYMGAYHVMSLFSCFALHPKESSSYICAHYHVI